MAQLCATRFIASAIGQSQFNLTQTGNGILNDNRVFVLQINHNICAHWRTFRKEREGLEQKVALNNLLLRLG